MPELTVCSSCGRKIFFVKPQEATGPIPVDARRVPLYREDGSTIGELGYVSHFLTCPNASAHSKKGSPGASVPTMTDETPMPFGRHRGKAMKDVPAGYLLWLGDELGPNPGSSDKRALRAYIDANRASMEADVEAAQRKRDERGFGID